MLLPHVSALARHAPALIVLIALLPLVLTAAPVPLARPGRLLRNPLLPGADPAVVYHQGFYYLIQSEQSPPALYVHKSATLADLGRGQKVCIHRAPSSGPRSRNLWAPELHLIDGRWYVYYAADDGDNDHHRMYVLESLTGDPQGAYRDRGKIADATDRWAIDGTVLRRADGALYFVWSGWESKRNGRQDLYIAAMSNPWTIRGPRVCLSRPTEPWERRSGAWPCYVNEAPAVLEHEGRLFIAYSANGFWSDDYCLGLLAFSGGLADDPTDPRRWVKSKGPVFSKTDDAFNVGHNCFLKSPDGTQDWILYHAIAQPGSGGRGRTIRAQRFEWHADGTPHFGRPVSPGAPIAGPSGEGEPIAVKLGA